MTFVLDCTDGTHLMNKGYSVVHRGNRKFLGHRVAYQEAYGEIGERHQIHHLCGNKACVEPDHLISVTNAQHAQMFDAGRPKQQFCRWGHDTFVTGRYASGRCKVCHAHARLRIHHR